MRNLKLIFEYDGNNFSGFELQPGKRTVRGELEKALKKIYKKTVKFYAASRTDSGVHALGQVINFKAPTSIPLDRIPSALNSVLPEDIRVIRAEEVSKRFNARFYAKSKTYEYLIFNGAIMPPHLRKAAWYVKPKLDLAAMQRAARFLVGKQDFSSFCAAGGDDKDFVRTLKKVKIQNSKVKIGQSSEWAVISLQFVGDGFLYKMVRNIVGTLVDVGLGKTSVGGFKGILEQKDRKKAGRTAPPQGLCLIKVNY